jgi:hypothetical protein
MDSIELKIEEYKSHIQRSYYRSLQSISKCSPEILEMDGMTGKNTRHLYNNLLDMPDTRYLEIGVWKGSSFFSAIYKNNVTYAYAVDNWSQFGGPKEDFLQNLTKYKEDKKITYIESNFRTLDFQSLPNFNVYLFDGPHEFDDHYNALALMLDRLDDVFIYIIDDWNWAQVRTATKLAIEQNDLQVMYSLEVMTTLDNNHSLGENCRQFWNGVAVFILQKKRSIRVKELRGKAAYETSVRQLPFPI